MTFSLTKVHIMRNFSLFIYYYIFGGEAPNSLSHSDEYINFHLHPEILKNLLVPSRERKGFSKMITKIFTKGCDDESRLKGFPEASYKYDISYYRSITNLETDRNHWIKLDVPFEV